MGRCFFEDYIAELVEARLVEYMKTPPSSFEPGAKHCFVSPS